MQEKKFIFISGLHRSGTSLLYKILKEQDYLKKNKFSDESKPETSQTNNSEKDAQSIPKEL